VDFDFYVPNARLADIAAAGAPHVVRAPERHRDSHWNLVFMKLVHGSREIELGGADDAQFYDTREGCGRHAGIDFGRSVDRTVLGVTVPTMPVQELIEYKRALGRDVDHADIAGIERAISQGAASKARPA
jgi:hypothetical protein